jgi:hypothetical protein
MDDFDDGIKVVKYFIDEIDEFKIHIYYNEFEEKRLEADLLNEQQLPETRYYLKDRVSEFTGNLTSFHIFYERTRFYGINADGSSHHFRMGVPLPEKVLKYFQNKFKNFRLMENRRLESGMQNKVFFIELMIKESIKNKTNQI